MSRLTSSPFHKPSAFEFPRVPPSPPETQSDTVIGPAHMLHSTHIPAAHEFGMLDPGLGANIDPPSRMKRSSSIPYHSNNFRETKERNAHRSGKSLIIVVPPSTLVQEHGQHGPSGPYHRLSQGVVMPLFPSVFGQLTAIAREFNFPSTSGLCLYFHYVEDGCTLTPRITDESWQILWGHLSEPLPPNERRSLISGKVEFDIDLRLARWYSAWVSSIHREVSEHYYPSTAPSVAHFQRESSQADSRQFEEDTGEISGIHQHSAPVGRHIPRKLSLVERFDVPSVRQDPKVYPRSLLSPPEHVPSSSQVLSTIFQEEEPKTGRRQLDTRVNSWRASAVTSPTPLAATGQTSLDPPNLPNNMPIDTPVDSPNTPAEEMRLEDYTWSVSSAGPQSCGDVSPTSWYHPPSLHIANRMQGSVCTSPSICTSFGPLDDNISFTSSGSRAPSPDIAQRFYEDSPSTPATATSWGAPLSYPSSPVYSFISDLPSPDLAHRFYEDSPPTPMTATSWGAPLFHPASPRCASPTPSLDIGDRTRFCEFEGYGVRGGSPWPHMWPYTSHHRQPPHIEVVDHSISRGTPWLHVWPYTVEYSFAAAQAPDQTSSRGAPWSHVWPYISGFADVKVVHILSPGTPWSYVWPYNNSSANVRTFSRDSPQPRLLQYNSECSSGTAQVLGRGLSSGTPWSHVWPYNIERDVEVTHQASFGYPYISTYPPIYPYLVIYPSVPGSMKSHSSFKSELPLSIEVRLSSAYPLFNLYPALYPYNLNTIYPVVITYQKENTDEGYPFFNIYPPISPPYFAHLSLHLHKPPSQYPDLEIYPQISYSSPDVEGRPLRHEPAQEYPIFNIYPAVYPYFNIYPSVPEREMETHLSNDNSIPHPHSDFIAGSGPSLRTTLDVTYPTFNLYPSVYPHFNIYPAAYMASSKTKKLDDQTRLSLSSALLPMYPSFNLYPPVYPHFMIYPSSYNCIEGKLDEGDRQPLTRTLASSYPYFNLYPGVYPYLEIYPAPYGTIGGEDSNLSLTTTLSFGYPYFNLYPGIYPHLDIYPTGYCLPSDEEGENDARLPSALPLTYPYFNLYPRVYPYLDIYPALYFPDILDTLKSLSATPTSNRPNSQYPFFVLYPPIYPHFELYLPKPEAAVVPLKTKAKYSSRLTHLELHAMVMMEKQGSHGHDDFIRGLRETGVTATSQTTLINEGKETDHSAPELRRTLRSSFATIQYHEVRKSMSHRAGSTPPDIPPFRNFRERDHSRSSSLREQPQSSSPHTLPRLAPRSRDSLVLQRVKAFDQNEHPSGLSKETLSKFPMPPRGGFPPLPPLPVNRGQSKHADG